ncbi:hypothetical protein Salat_2547200 [Sesamum alatum]|uniref:Uncharacterized protein n=1 Tax=Sesamum alatum TaxID=300844 RepID=A0AAE2CCM9_9LAMI|nr:hypothetical protein Salat_2547200 [Sesamum alatum]
MGFLSLLHSTLLTVFEHPENPGAYHLFPLVLSRFDSVTLPCPCLLIGSLCPPGYRFFQKPIQTLYPYILRGWRCSDRLPLFSFFASSVFLSGGFLRAASSSFFKS